MNVESLRCIELHSRLVAVRFEDRIAPMRAIRCSTTLDSIETIPPSGARPPGPSSSLRLVASSGRSDA